MIIGIKLGLGLYKSKVRKKRLGSDVYSDFHAVVENKAGQ